MTKPPPLLADEPRTIRYRIQRQLIWRMCSRVQAGVKSLTVCRVEAVIWFVTGDFKLARIMWRRDP